MSKKNVWKYKHVNDFWQMSELKPFSLTEPFLMFYFYK